MEFPSLAEARQGPDHYASLNSLDTCVSGSDVSKERSVLQHSIISTMKGRHIKLAVIVLYTRRFVL